jgi:hypothetical protein
MSLSGSIALAEARAAAARARARTARTRLADCEAALDEAWARIEVLHARAEAAEALVAALRGSTSWRVTRPLRGVVEGARALFGTEPAPAAVAVAPVRSVGSLRMLGDVELMTVRAQTVLAPCQG